MNPLWWRRETVHWTARRASGVLIWIPSSSDRSLEGREPGKRSLGQRRAAATGG